MGKPFNVVNVDHHIKVLIIYLVTLILNVKQASEFMMASVSNQGLFLPAIVQATSRVKNAQELNVVGSSQRQRPSTCPTSVSLSRENSVRQRSATSHANAELVTLLSQKFCGRGILSLKQGFKAFDPKGEGHISREALYRLLCNCLSGITSKQYSSLLESLDLHSFKTISFQEFCSRFNGPSIPPYWFDPVSRRQTRGYQSVSQQQTRGYQSVSQQQTRGYELKECVPKANVQRHPKQCTTPHSGENYFKSLDSDQIALIQQCQQLDTLKTGKLSMEQIRLVLTNFGIRVTPIQMVDLCSSLGYREGQLVCYSSLLARFASRSGNCVVHSILTSKDQRFHEDDSRRACTSVGDVERRLVFLLQDKFIKLLAAFKSHDPKSKGFVPKSLFVSILQTHVGVDPDISTLTDFLANDSEWVPYPKFLAMFENGKTLKRVSDDVKAVTTKKHDNKLAVFVRDVVSNQTTKFIECFHLLDASNTGRLSLHMTVELLEMFGVKCTVDDLRYEWDGLVKNKDGTVYLQEFLRHYSHVPEIEGHFKQNLMTEDHFFMRSKTLHRDGDIMLNTVCSKLRYYQPTILKYLSKFDVHTTGSVPVAVFMDCLVKICPEFSMDELSSFIRKFQDSKTGVVHYASLLCLPKPNPYRDGSNMATVLAHSSSDGLSSNVPPTVLTARPPYGIPGVKLRLQKQIAKKWRVIRRLFRGLDRNNFGSVSVGEFWTVLEKGGVELSSEDKFNILEMFDPHLSGHINYRQFINTLFEQ